jgi:hypothetical protein
MKGRFCGEHCAGTRVPIRAVREEKGVSVLRYEARELRNGVHLRLGRR